MSQNKLLALAAFVLGLFALFVGTPRRSQPQSTDLIQLARQIENEDDHVTPGELASAIMANDHSFRLYDLRDSASYNVYHIPTAIRADIDSLLKSPVNPADSIILYSEGGTHASQAWVLLRIAGYTKIRTLKNGLQAWNDEVIHPPASGNHDLLTLLSSRATFFGGAVASQQQAVSTDSASKPKQSVVTHRIAKKIPPPPNNSRVEERTREGC